MITKKKGSQARQKIAIVLLSSFIAYHLAAGFDDLLLLFDDPLDSSLEEARKHSQATLAVHDAELKKQWMRTSLFANDVSVRETLGSEVISRQMLNAEVTIDLAREKDADWLLHLIGDELFYSSSQTVAEHFGKWWRRLFASSRT